MTAPDRPLRVAIAGCHRMLDRVAQSHNWATAFAAVPETEIVGVFDYGAETRQAFKAIWGDIPDFDDYPRMLEAVKPDIVCIATRQTMHADQCEQAVAAGVRAAIWVIEVPSRITDVAAPHQASGVRQSDP